MLNVHRIINQTIAEGPGTRCCVCLQGCSIHCEGCFAKDTWDFSDRLLMAPAGIIGQMHPTEEGITVCGGEPFDQKKELAELLCLAWEKGLSTVLYTGYTYESLTNSHDENVATILSHTDILMDGPFVLSQLSTENPLIGSSNQRIRFLTKRYSFKDMRRNKLEVRIKKNGIFSINGMAEYNKIHELTL